MVYNRLTPVKLKEPIPLLLRCLTRRNNDGEQIRRTIVLADKTCNIREYSSSEKQKGVDLNQTSKNQLLSKYFHKQRNIDKTEVFPRSLGMSTTAAQSEALAKKYKPNEIRVETPYGHIAALEWGNRAAPKKILCMHGWLDNAGSFEMLIPYILDHNENDKKFHIVAMDQPGVGLSSHKPPGADYTDFSSVMEMRRVIQHFNWENVILMSHSFGAHLSFLYCCIYPNQVEAMVSIDLAQPLTRQVKNWNIAIANSIEDHFKSEYHNEDDPTTNIRVPVYSEVDAIKRLVDSHHSSLTQETAKILLKRGAKKQRWGFTFNRDVRHRHLSLEFRPEDDAMLRYMEPFKPKLLVIRAARSPFHRPEHLRLRYYELFKKNCPIFRDVLLDGTHHLHMNDPDIVAIEINKFFEEIDDHDSSSQNIKSNL